MLAARSLRASALSNIRASVTLFGHNAKVNRTNAQIRVTSRPFFSDTSKEEDKTSGMSNNQQESDEAPKARTWKSRLREILESNKLFAESEEWKMKIAQAAPPQPRVAEPRAIIITCMDTRLTSLVPAAMNLKQGEAKVIRTAGGIVTHNFGGIMRSILIGLYELNGDEVYIVGHDDCGMRGNSVGKLLEKIKKRTNVTDETLRTLGIAGVDIDKWLTGFEDVEDSVRSSVQIVRDHPLVPNDVPIHGFVIDPRTAKMRLVVDGNEYVHGSGAKDGVDVEVRVDDGAGTKTGDVV